MRETEATLSITVPLHLTARIPDGSGPYPVLVGLHGYGMTGQEMMAFLPRLAPDGFLVVSLEGPHSTLLLDGKKPRGAFHWGVTPRVDEVRAAHRASVAAAIAWALENGGDRERVSLAGFSQPCSHNYRLSLSPPHGKPFRVLAALCGGIPGEWSEGARPDTRPEATAKTAVFHASAGSDEFYPLPKIAAFGEKLSGYYEDVTHRTYEGGHRIPSAALPEIRELLATRG